MTELSVGKEVLSYCNKCKLTLAHMIVAMKDVNTIYKVQCKTCKSTHAYKDPSAVKVKKVTAKVKKASPGSSKRSAASVSDLWMDAVNNATTKSKAYSIKIKFELGDIIDHPKFGPGVVDKCIDGDKIEVIFRHDIKTLMHNK
ncbi:hypothetical protein M899_3002 [Bacteriovorax sp. BSW11_IV]|uniref:hypothetical protein n=1 Tax=Bacteriovorax sp. BSW11_IV TaxID=1353529 RepID=UPI000389F191|nr:hypothetical protein [Bacteriovorax sp. BSW11_IV]EQC43599.1 hypothetical protein M899_3002 [Bacteriovorax sp. BSW11_IV]